MKRSHVAPVLAAALVAVAALTTVWALRRRAVVPVNVIEAPRDESYATTIKPIFDRRCVPCHACFDSPCQLNLQTFEGLDRGANKAIVYQPQRPLPAPPTRMFQDAQRTPEWQLRFGFFPVVDRTSKELDRAILWRFVEQRAHDPRGGTFDVDKTTTCPATIADTEAELREHPERGMPFGLPPLEKGELDAIASWLRKGAGGVSGAPEESDAMKRTIAAWEAFFNRSDPRAPLVSAYLFEHLFYAHLYVDGEWFRLVRSRTKSGEPIEEIATRRPYDDVAVNPFYYRLRRIHETVVLKTHAPYVLNDAKLARLQDLFYGTAWEAKWNRVIGNPLITYAAIPARARYQFMLDDAHFFVQTFIHGPVCRGQAALDVIDEHFLIFFLAPDADPAIVTPGYLDSVAPSLVLPAEKGESIAALSPGYDAKEIAYLRAEIPHVRARSLADVWHGDGTNPDAVLTVFRHFDTAFVMRGAVGGMPKTAWLIDYPTFERIYYDLVAGFDVYGNVAHQVGTRIYMNYLRIEAEGQFLRLLPISERERVAGEWYRGRVARALAGMHVDAMRGPETAIAFDDKSRAKQALIARLFGAELPAAVAGPREPIQWPDVPFSGDPLRGRVERAMRDIANRTGPHVAPFPDSALFAVRSSEIVYTIARNRSHTSVEFIFGEDVELEPAEDTLQVVSGVATSRPNLFFVIDEKDLDAFFADWRALRSETWGAFVARWAVRRSDPRFWAGFDFVSTLAQKADPLGSAVLDLSRYTND